MKNAESDEGGKHLNRWHILAHIGGFRDKIVSHVPEHQRSYIHYEKFEIFNARKVVEREKVASSRKSRAEESELTNIKNLNYSSSLSDSVKFCRIHDVNL